MGIYIYMPMLSFESAYRYIVEAKKIERTFMICHLVVTYVTLCYYYRIMIRSTRVTGEVR